MRRQVELLRNLYLNQPCVIADLGARNGFSMLKALHPFAVVHAVEPELRAANDLRNSSPHFKKFVVHELAIAGKEGDAMLYVTHNGSMSSLLEPDIPEFERGFGEVMNAQDWMQAMEVTGRQKVKTTTLSAFASEQKIAFIDFLKIDTQGNELDILESGKQLLQAGGVGVMCVEAALHPIYKNQRYFSDVDIFLRECGYRLVEFRTYAEDVMKEDEFAAGEKIYERPKHAPVGDAWYVCDSLEGPFRTRAAVVLACEGYFSEAAFLFGNTLTGSERNSLFRKLSKHSAGSRMKHFLKRWTPLAVQQWRSKMRKR